MHTRFPQALHAYKRVRAITVINNTPNPSLSSYPDPIDITLELPPPLEARQAPSLLAFGRLGKVELFMRPFHVCIAFLDRCDVTIS